MRKLSVSLLAILVVLTSSTIIIFADSQNQWQYSKEVYFENQEEVKAIYLDEDIYRLAKEDLSDVRLIDEKNEFIPYYIYNRFLSASKVEYTEYKGKEVHTFMKDNNYHIDFEIIPQKENSDVLGNLLRMAVSKDSFYKDLHIYGSYDNKSWESIKLDAIYKVNGIEKLTVSLDDTYKYLYYRIISRNDTSGVAINGLSLAHDVDEALYDEYKGLKKVDHRVEVNNESNETIINIHNKDKLKLDSMRLATEGDFNRSYILYITNDQGERLGEAGSGEIFKLDLGQFKIENTSIPIVGATDSFIRSEYLQLAIKDRDNYPISIKDMEISYYIDKMVFKSNVADKIHIIFGNEATTKPYYDINAYIEEIEAVKQESASLGNLVVNELEEKVTDKPFEFKWVLNISVVLISGLLYIVIIRKSKFSKG